LLWRDKSAYACKARHFGVTGVMNRDDQRERIFRSSQDRELFLKTFGQACEKADWQVHPWFLGNEAFRKELLAQMSTSPKPAGTQQTGDLRENDTTHLNGVKYLLESEHSGRFEVIPGRWQFKAQYE
jgi:hypothetical protein